MDKKMLSILMVLMIFTISFASATEPIVSDHRTFDDGFYGWNISPEGSWWVASSINEYLQSAVAKTNTNTSNPMTSIEFQNWTDTHGMNTSMSEIDFEWMFLAYSNGMTTEDFRKQGFSATIYEKTTDAEYRIVVVYSLTSHNSSSEELLYLKEISMKIYKGTDEISEMRYETPNELYIRESGENYANTYKTSIFQINYDGKTHFYMLDNRGYHHIETEIIVPVSIKPKITVYYPSFCTDNFTFELAYFNIDAYATTYHKEIINETPTQEKAFFDILPVQNISFALMLFATFVLSVSKKIDMPENISYLALLSGIAVILYSVANYYIEGMILPTLVGMSPFTLYLLKDKFLNRKKMLR